MNVVELSTSFIGKPSKFNTPAVEFIPLLGLVPTGVVGVQDKRQHHHWLVSSYTLQVMWSRVGTVLLALA